MHEEIDKGTGLKRTGAKGRFSLKGRSVAVKCKEALVSTAMRCGGVLGTWQRTSHDSSDALDNWTNVVQGIASTHCTDLRRCSWRPWGVCRYPRSRSSGSVVAKEG
ncbi:hypothetical protein WDL1P2_00270 (plasmid) [Variovorax sp. WDL1]|nr:hypothetical protein CHC07_06649 [Variovorax sp. B4]PNG49715.1 hypothetical protein CHC06_05296 [Variovorax sp. B2]VTV18585.1 hypothetical protein WDL1P2_00270 [Variovorax sp. WDL1]